MKAQEIFVENVKCHGCMTTIKSSLLKIAGVESVDVNLEEEKITVGGQFYDRKKVVDKLNALGYPEKGNNTLFNQAKSYVSCAIGKVS